MYVHTHTLILCMYCTYNYFVAITICACHKRKENCHSYETRNPPVILLLLGRHVPLNIPAEMTHMEMFCSEDSRTLERKVK